MVIPIAELVPSKAVRDFMEKQGRILTDFEKATLIYNHSSISHEEKMKALTSILEMTEDVELRTQILARMAHDESCVKKFYKRAKDEIYELRVWLPDDQEWCPCGLFVSGELAVTCGKKFKERFAVDKRKLIMEEIEPDDCDSKYVSSLTFTAQGSMNDYCSTEVIWDDEGYGVRRFENAYIDIPHPFKNGDFVRVLNNNSMENDIGIVECGLAEMKGAIIRVQRNSTGDYYDASLRIAILHGDAKFGHEHVMITDLEFASIAEDDPRKPLLECGSSLITGAGGLSDFQFLCDEYSQKVAQKQ